MLTVRTSENTVITSFRLISERQDFSSVRTGENTVRARARIHREDFENSARIFDYMFESKSPSRSRILSSVRTAWYPKSRLKVTSEFYGLTFS